MPKQKIKYHIWLPDTTEYQGRMETLDHYLWAYSPQQALAMILAKRNLRFLYYGNEKIRGFIYRMLDESDSSCGYEVLKTPNKEPDTGVIEVMPEPEPEKRPPKAYQLNLFEE